MLKQTIATWHEEHLDCPMGGHECMTWDVPKAWQRTSIRQREIKRDNTTDEIATHLEQAHSPELMKVK